MFKAAFVGVISLALCGCSNYPLPQDYTGAKTADIVANIRCEARAAIRRAALDKLESYGDRKIYHSLSGIELARQLRTKSIPLDQFTIKDLVPDVRKTFDYYRHTQIAFDFTLEGNEKNTQGVQFGLTKGIVSPLDTIDLHGMSTRERDLSRNFITMDTFEYLALSVTDEFCKNAWKNVNVVYPLEGRLPIFDLVQSYIDINSLDHLIGKDDGDLKGTDSEPATPTMADTIMFTTTLDANIDPTLNYNPLAKVFSLTSLAIQNDNSRQDKHQVIATLTTSPVDPKTKKPSSKESIRQDSVNAIKSQRAKLVEDSIISIGAALSRPGTSLFNLR